MNTTARGITDQREKYLRWANRSEGERFHVVEWEPEYGSTSERSLCGVRYWRDWAIFHGDPSMIQDYERCKRCLKVLEKLGVTSVKKAKAAVAAAEQRVVAEAKSRYAYVAGGNRPLLRSVEILLVAEKALEEVRS